MNYQCYLANKIAKDIKAKNLGLVCNSYCNYYDLILFNYIEDDLESIDCAGTAYSEDYSYIIPDKNLPIQTQLDSINEQSSSTGTINCSWSDPEILDDNTDIAICSNQIIIEFINQDGVVTNNPNDGVDMRDTYYEFTYNGAETLTLPANTLLRNIIFIPTSTVSIKVGTSLAADDVVFEESITTAADNYPYTLNTYYESGITLYFTSNTTVKVRVYVD